MRAIVHAYVYAHRPLICITCRPLSLGQQHDTTQQLNSTQRDNYAGNVIAQHFSHGSSHRFRQLQPVCLIKVTLFEGVLPLKMSHVFLILRLVPFACFCLVQTPVITLLNSFLEARGLLLYTHYYAYSLRKACIFAHVYTCIYTHNT